MAHHPATQWSSPRQGREDHSRSGPSVPCPSRLARGGLCPAPSIDVTSNTRAQLSTARAQGTRRNSNKPGVGKRLASVVRSEHGKLRRTERNKGERLRVVSRRKQILAEGATRSFANVPATSGSAAQGVDAKTAPTGVAAVEIWHARRSKRRREDMVAGRHAAHQSARKGGISTAKNTKDRREPNEQRSRR